MATLSLVRIYFHSEFYEVPPFIPPPLSAFLIGNAIWIQVDLSFFSPSFLPPTFFFFFLCIRTNGKLHCLQVVPAYSPPDPHCSLLYPSLFFI